MDEFAKTGGLEQRRIESPRRPGPLTLQQAEALGFQLLELFHLALGFLSCRVVEARLFRLVAHLLGQEADHDLVGRQHRLGGVARVEAADFGELRLEPRGPLVFGLVGGTGEVGDEVMEDDDWERLTSRLEGVAWWGGILPLGGQRRMAYLNGVSFGGGWRCKYMK